MWGGSYRRERNALVALMLVLQQERILENVEEGTEAENERQNKEVAELLCLE